MNPILYVWGTIISLLYIAYDVYTCDRGQHAQIIGGSSFHSYCFPKNSKFKLQPQQKFVATYMDPKKRNHHALLLIHKIGSGKTCSAIQIANKYVGKQHRPLILMPASLIPGFYTEARSPCSGLKILEKDAMNMVLDKTYNIMSYNKFFTNPPKDASCLIIDEVQNVDNIKGNIFTKIMKWTEAHSNCPVVVMTATPIFDSPKELRGIAMIMGLPGTDDDITPGSIRKMFAGVVSVYEGAPSYTFPKIKLKIKKCPMSSHQAVWYKKQVEAERTRAGTIKLIEHSDNFYVKSRQKSNVVYPNGITSSEFKGSHVDKLDVYSCKVAALCGLLRKGKLAFIYSSFTGAYGIGFLSMVLQKQGWKSFDRNPGKKCFAIWSGEQTRREKDRIREVFNSVENDDGSQLQIIIGSPAIKEGVSLFRVRQVHILEAYWNHSRLEQIYGRAVRYCSHKRLPADDRNVTIYIYCAVLGQGRPIPEESIDLYMLHMADEKRIEARPYLEALKQCAVDKNKYNLK